eukprot:COSAG02_NODE_7270_length_3089_cov_2.598662_2_plen_577_part_01
MPETSSTAIHGENLTHGDIIGRGGSGVVRKGTLRLADGAVVPVAIKTLGMGATQKDMVRFEKEFRVSLQASGSCSRVCHIYGSLWHEGTLCLVMKLYRCSLHAYLDERRSPDGSTMVKPLAYDVVVAFAAQILEGLAQLHTLGIVVQDLKPANILMNENHQCVISDFGLATFTSTLTTTQSSMVVGGGTPAYKAPEQYDEESFGKISTKTDMWAFGCVVIELITGFAPWKGMQSYQIMMSVAGKCKAPSIPTTTPEHLATILQNCLTHEQLVRPTAESALASLHGQSLCEPHIENRVTTSAMHHHVEQLKQVRIQQHQDREAQKTANPIAVESSNSVDNDVDVEGGEGKYDGNLQTGMRLATWIQSKARLAVVLMLFLLVLVLILHGRVTSPPSQPSGSAQVPNYSSGSGSNEQCGEYWCLHGSCHNGKCVCALDYHGPDCGTFCQASTNCSGHGRCHVTERKCADDTTWFASFSGHSCSHYKLNSGTFDHQFCTDDTNDDGVRADVACPIACRTCPNAALCQCTNGYIGRACQIQDTCHGVRCSEHGSCSGGRCACEGGYSGDSCQTYDECFGVEC